MFRQLNVENEVLFTEDEELSGVGQGNYLHQHHHSLYIGSSKIQGNTSDHYVNRVVFLMKSLRFCQFRPGSSSFNPNLTKQYKISKNLRPVILDFGSAFT